MLMSFFFFKQKTAYERRISDWSSDVCSSDLHEVRKPALGGDIHPRIATRPVLRHACPLPVHLRQHRLRRLVAVARRAQELVERDVVFLPAVRVQRLAPPAHVRMAGAEARGDWKSVV